jgi:predicted amidohydrolase YtcJ
MKTFVRCGQLFTGREDEALSDATLVYDGAGEILYAGPSAAAPKRGKGDCALDHSGHFVMPGLIDVHTHLAYGNAKTEGSRRSLHRRGSLPPPRWLAETRPAGTAPTRRKTPAEPGGAR